MSDYSDFAVPASSVSTPAASGPDYSDFASPTTVGDPAVYALMGEAGTDPQGQIAVASTIVNRQAKSKAKSPTEVVTNPANGYEAWNDPAARAKTMAQFPPGSAQYQAAQQTLNQVAAGTIKPLPYDSFYSPKAQSALGRSKPQWDDGSGVNVGGNVFFAGKYQPQASTQVSTNGADSSEPGMTDAQAEAAYQAAHPTAATPPAAPITRIEWNAKTNRYEDAGGTPYERTGSTTVEGPGGSQYVITPNAPAKTGQIPIKPATGLDSGTTDTTRAAFMPGVAQGVEGVGSTFKNLDQFVEQHVHGAQAFNQFVNGAGYPSVDQQVQALHASRVLNDARFAGNPAYGAGKVAGTIAATTPFMMEGGQLLPEVGAGGNLFARGAALSARGAAEGAGAGALASGGNDQSLAQNMGTGAAAGAVLGPAIPAAIGAARNMFSGDVSPAVADLANTAVNKYGIPLRVGQIKGAAGDRAASVQDSNDIARPETGFAGNNAQQWQAFSKAVTGTYGDDSGVMSPANMSAAKSKIGGQIGAIAQRNNITDADRVLTDMDTKLHDAAQYTTEPQMAPLLKLRQAIGSVVTPGEDGAPAQISGSAYARLIAKNGPLDRAQNSSDGAIRAVANDMRDALDDGFEDSVSPGELRDFQNARFQYKNLMTIADLAKKANVEGQISPQFLAGAVNRSFKNRAFSGAGDLGELSQIAQTLMKEPPQSGTPPRVAEMLKNMFVPGVAGGLDVGLAFHNPMLAAQLGIGGIAAMGARTGLNAARGAIARSAPARNMLLNGIQPGPVGNAFLNGARTLQPALVPAGAIEAQNLFAGHYGPQALLPPPPVTNPPTPAQR